MEKIRLQSKRLPFLWVFGVFHVNYNNESLMKRKEGIYFRKSLLPMPALYPLWFLLTAKQHSLRFHAHHTKLRENAHRYAGQKEGLYE